MLFALSAVAQRADNPLSDSSSTHFCDIVISGNFDSDCIFDFKDEVTDEYPDLLIACKHSSVTYTAYANTGSNSTLNYNWEVFGHSSLSVSGNQISVDWSDNEWGMVVVTATSPDGDTCTVFRRVKLIDNPTVGIASVPPFTILPDGRKVVRVCQGASVQFIDQSSAGNSDIAGYHWECRQAAPSSTPDYLVEDIYRNDVVIHRVYNNCGCFDEDSIEIEMIDGANLELECYGTVCENAIVTYHTLSPLCSEYHWYVDGGTIIAGQGSPDPVVQWDHPSGGYGVIGLDGVLCGEIACPTLMSRKIPVIQDRLPVEGPTELCIGDAVVFSLPLFGSTEYNWSISPSAGVNTDMMSQANEVRLVFNQAGTYHLRCSYRCEFLDCGPFDAEPITIIVRPKLDITGNSQICLSNACSLLASPSVNAAWTAFDLANGNSVVATQQGSSFSHTFDTPGRYLITAEHPDYCGPATFVMTVKDVPPAPTINDLDPANRHTACPGLGIALSGTPSQPNYSLVWQPTDPSASPQLYSGDSVTISYQPDVCDVRVYNYDRVLQCQSTSYYVHQVSELVPAPIHIPGQITVCPNSLIVWGNDAVPDQSSEGMLYEWTIQDDMQYCASIQGSHLSNSVVLAVNDITTPASFYVTLTRTFCGNVSSENVIHIQVLDSISHPLSISGPDEVCVNSTATYLGSGGSNSNYHWSIEGVNHGGTPIDHTFRQEGLVPVTLYENPFDYCTNKSYLNQVVKIVSVNSLPMVQGLSVDAQAGFVFVVPSLDPNDYSYSWTFQASAQDLPIALPEISDHAPISSTGTYSCTVTDVRTGCSKSVSLFCQPNLPTINCDPLSLLGDYETCSHSVSLRAGIYPSVVSWKVSGGDFSISMHGTNNHYADITFENIGIYTVSASTGINNCYEGYRVFAVEFIPNFHFTPGCDKILINNASQFIQPGEMVYVSVSNSRNSNTDIISFPVSQTSFTYTPTSLLVGTCTYTFTLTGYGSNGNITPCVLGTATIGSPLLPVGTSAVSISTSNPYSPTQTCDNTPIELTASLGYPGSIVSSTWDFDDGSSFYTEGNSIFHTFEEGHAYYLGVQIVDNYGCIRSTQAPLRIMSNSNPLVGARLVQLDDNICPYELPSIRASFSADDPSNHYSWWRLKDPTRVVSTNPYYTSVSDDYFVFAINDNYCQKEASTFIKYLNSPTAYIYADNLNFCIGDEVRLYGDQGPSSDQLSYMWSVSGPGFSRSFSTPDIVFSPTSAGSYNVSLTITNTSTSCSASTSETITINAKPTAPSLSFVGSPCISDAPVHLAASGFSGEMHWSNGNTGPDAYYFTHGLASAYYYDPAIGCPSESSTIRIHKEPDFDALLTGCYEKCKYFFSNTLPIYGLTDNAQYIDWEWYLNGTTIASGSGTYSNIPIQLPLTGYGDYQMLVDYSGGNCSGISPLLTIDNKDTCDCQDLDVSYKYEWHVEDCKIFYDVDVTVCNNSTTRDCLRNIEYLFNTEHIDVVYTDFASTTLNPGDCYSFHLTILVSQFFPSSTISFRLYDECNNCTTDFSINLMPEKIDCEMDMQLLSLDINPGLSSNVAAYFDFKLDVSPCQNLIAFWTEPPMVINYWYDGAATVYGLGMVDYATLTQLMAENGNICFYAITCEGDHLCKRMFCIPAEEVYNILHDMGLAKTNTSGGSKGGNTKRMPNPDLGNDTDPRLMPNPTTGEVNVIGTTDEVVEVLVMDMNGRQMATFVNTKRFNIAHLATGHYIVRLKTQHNTTEKVTYLKLVKK